MPHKVCVSEEAVRHIQTIGDYIAQDSRTHATVWIRGIHRVIESLSEHPERFPVVYKPEEVGREVRRTLYGVFSIYYTIESDLIHVLSIRHGRGARSDRPNSVA